MFACEPTLLTVHKMRMKIRAFPLNLVYTDGCHFNTYSERKWKLRIFFHSFDHSLAHKDISMMVTTKESVCVFYAQCSARLTQSINTFVFECIEFDCMALDILANQFRSRLCKCVQCAFSVVNSCRDVLFLDLMSSHVDYIH